MSSPGNKYGAHVPGNAPLLPEQPPVQPASEKGLLSRIKSAVKRKKGRK